MLSVSKTALERLSHRLVRKGAPEDMALRFTRREGGWTLLLDHESHGDTAFSYDGRKVLLLDSDAVNRMADMSLDTRSDNAKSRFKLTRRRASGE